MNRLHGLIGLILLSFQVQAFADFHARVIYGTDDRIDYNQATPEQKRMANATVALMRATDLTTQGATTLIRTSPYGTGRNLCSSEPFYSQETAAFCSGFLLAPDLVVTAGHCVRSEASCPMVRFVIGFRIEHEGDLPRSVPSENVYSCAQLIHSVSRPAGEDFAVVKLDRPVTQSAPLSFRQAGVLAVGDQLTVMGHPVGLPLKIAPGGTVRAMGPEFLVANLDTYGGNSGSAVFNSTTGEVEGILVRGEMDFKTENGCRVSNVCPPDGCRGEDVTLIERVRPYIP